jgi:hypothetical protein
MGGHVATGIERNQEIKLIDWEQLESTKGLTVLRIRVPGGWLVYASNSYHHHGGMTFYPDPDHRWQGGTLPPDSI